MTRYVGILEKDEGSLWGIWFPDVPGCVTAGETMEEALANAPEVLALFAEVGAEHGEEMPLPRNLSELKQDPDVRAALAKGDVAVLVPLVRNSGRTIRANISIDAGTLAAIDEAAKARGLTRSAFLVSAARDKILSEV
jgi:predicted RNase H-like HicB family nuclease